MSARILSLVAVAVLVGCGGSISTVDEGAEESTWVDEAGVSRPRLNVNLASSTELQTLPGIGQVLAEAIVADRQANGPFFERPELLRVSGIGEATYRKIKEKIMVGGCTAARGCALGLSCELRDESRPQLGGVCLPDEAPSCAAVLCAQGTVCELQEVQCIRAPCYPIPACVPVVDACATVRCAGGTVCEVQNGSAVCVPEATITCANVRCAGGTVCEMQNGSPVCVPQEPEITCANVLCAPYTFCEMQGGQPVCVELTNTCKNVRCSAGQHCEMQEVQCIAAPCYPQPVCVEDDRIVCPQIYDPVCGEDGVTYSNSCHAAAAGVSVVSADVCP